MERKSFKYMECSIAHSLDYVGEWWGILIIREVFYGAKRFDEFQRGIVGIAPTTFLRSRLKSLVDKGILKKVIYLNRPVRYEYLLTLCKENFYSILITLFDWNNKYFANYGVHIQLENIKTKQVAIPYIADKNTNKELTLNNYRIIAGPDASDRLRDKINVQIGLSNIAKNQRNIYGDLK